MRPYLLLALFAPIFLSAQPVLQYGNVQLLGNTYTIAAVIDPGSSNPEVDGEDVTWDFSTAITTGAGAASFISPVGTPYAAAYPTANLCLRLNVGGGDRYSYYILSPSGMDMLADDLGSPDAVVYTDPKTILQFPFAYGNFFVDDFAYDGTDYSVTRACTGHGTVVFPSGSVAGVLKIGSTDGSIEFFVSEPGGPLVGIDPEGAVLWDQNNVGLEERTTATAVRVWPNPGRDRVRVEGLHGASTWRLIDAQGRVQRSGTTNGADFVLIEFADLASGQYVIQIGDAKYWSATPVVRE